MKKIKLNNLYEGKRVENLYEFLNRFIGNEVIIRTTKVSGGWHDNEFSANRAGFNIRRTFTEEFNGFDEVYVLERKRREFNPVTGELEYITKGRK